MDWQTPLTVLPTAIAASLFSLSHVTFLSSMSRRQAPLLPQVHPWVSILKPVAGADEGLRENLASFIGLDYPAYELLIGIASPDDPAVPVVQAFLAAHPEFPARLVWTALPAGPILNPKVAQLIPLSQAARVGARDLGREYPRTEDLPALAHRRAPPAWRGPRVFGGRGYRGADVRGRAR